MAQKLTDKKLAVLGTGKLGGILLRAYLKQGLFSAKRVTATVKHSREGGGAGERAWRQRSHGKPKGGARRGHCAAGCEAASGWRSVERNCAGVEREDTGDFGGGFGADELHRAACGRESAGGASDAEHVLESGHRDDGNLQGRTRGAEDLETARAMFDAVGRTVVVDEKHMDAVTGLSASGPAFAYIILESFAEAGVKVGLPRDVSTLLAAQMMKGAASVVLETGDHPALLKDAVTTPAGCTIDGILELEEGKLRVTLIKAVVKATHRAGELLFEK